MDQIWGIFFILAAKAPLKATEVLLKMREIFLRRRIRKTLKTLRMFQSQEKGCFQIFDFSVIHHLQGTISSSIPNFLTSLPSGPGLGSKRYGWNFFLSIFFKI